MKVAPCHQLLTLLTLFTLFTLLTWFRLLTLFMLLELFSLLEQKHVCLYTLLGKVRMLLELDLELLSKKWEWATG